jgi:uncharacterized protein YfeS
MREKCPGCNQPFGCIGPNIVGDLTRKILADKRRNSVLRMQKLLVQGGMGLKNSQNLAIAIAFMETRWTSVLNKSKKDRDLQR